MVGIGLVGAAVVGTPTVAVADPGDGLSEASHTRYELDGAGPVRVAVTLTLRNEKADSGGYSYYWDSYGIPVPAGATDVVATSGGSALRVDVEPSEDPSTVFATASFAPLNQGRERTIEWTYTIPGEPIRSDGYTRVGPGYATFAVNGPGDAGQVTVEVVTPTAMSFDSTADVFEPILEGATRTHRATSSTDDYGIWAFVSARDPEQVDETSFEVDGTRLTLASFPGDAEWSTFVQEQVTAGLPLLESAVGHEWPGGLETIREDVSPEVLGYAWFDSASGEIVIPEDLDAGLLFHELSHAWLHGGSLEDRWLYEGLAELVGQRVAEATGGPREPREAPARDAADALALTAWQEVDLEAGADAVEEYAYAASATAMSALVGDLDDATLAAVVGGTLSGESAYEAPGSSTANDGRTDWQRFLDLVEVRGGVAGAADTYRTWVVDAEQAPLLDERAAAREAYVAIDETDGAWSPPAGLRTAMTGWEFAAAATVRDALGADVAADAGDVQRAAEAAGMPAPAAVRALYEDAASDEEYAALATVLPRAADVVEVVGEASRTAARDRDPFSDLGEVLLGVDRAAAAARAAVDAGQLDAAAGSADDALSRSGLAPWAGAGVVVLALAALAGAVLVVLRARRRRAAPATAPGDGPDATAPAAPAVHENGEAAPEESDVHEEPDVHEDGEADPEGRETAEVPVRS